MCGAAYPSRVVQTLLSLLHGLGVVPVVALTRADDAVPVVAALRAGGLPSIEITFRTAAAVEAIERVRDALPDVLLGAGTVLRPDQADAAVAAGARFVVTPGFNPRVVDHCLARSIPVVPGVATPGEVEAALERGIELVKFFPAEALGGTRFLAAVAGPYPTVRFVPSGGLRSEHLAEYLALPNVAACGGTWLAPADTVAAGDWLRVEEHAREAVGQVVAAGRRRA